MPAPTTPSAETLLLDSRRARWAVRMAAVVAAALCGFLAWQKLSGRVDSLAGCGGPEGCAQILGGRWASWFGVPVSLLATGFYLGVFILTLAPIQRWWGRIADRLLCAAAFTALGLAAWFLGIMAHEQRFCPYCAVAHGLGALLAGFVLWDAWRSRNAEGHGFFSSALPVAMLGMGGIIIGQIFGPRPATYRITNAAWTAEMGFRFDPTLHPHEGAATQPHVVVKFFDYACAACRESHHDLTALQKASPEPLLVVYVICPLSRDCNAHYTGHENRLSCDFARISLAVWHSAPQRWPSIHHELMAYAARQDLEGARLAAAGIFGSPDALERAQAEDWVAQRLRENSQSFQILSRENPKMPKFLLGPKRVWHGLAENEATFVNRALQELGLGSASHRKNPAK